MIPHTPNVHGRYQGCARWDIASFQPSFKARFQLTWVETLALILSLGSLLWWWWMKVTFDIKQLSLIAACTFCESVASIFRIRQPGRFAMKEANEQECPDHVIWRTLRRSVRKWLEKTTLPRFLLAFMLLATWSGFFCQLLEMLNDTTFMLLRWMTRSMPHCA